MQTEKADNRTAQLKAPCLIVTDVDNRQTFYGLAEGNSILAGSGETCAIRLSSGEANPLHCMFQLSKGTLWAQDWNTEGRTLLNGRPLEDAISMSERDELLIGTYRISAHLQDSSESLAPHSRQQSSCSEQSDACQRKPMQISAEQRGSNDVEGESVLESPDAVDPFDQGDRVPRPDGFVENPSLSSLSDHTCLAASAEDEEREILRNEVAYLQAELAERDAQLQQLINTEPFSNQPNCDGADDSQTEKLVARLEQLLIELDGADEKVAVLENLLQVSEEANQAEQEERRQLESWVNQIEQRVLAREAETAAESEKLQSCLQEERLRRSQLEAQLNNIPQLGGQANAADQAAKNVIDDLRRQNTDLQDRLSESRRQLEMKTVTPLQTTAVDPQVLRKLEQRVRALASELAGERAEIARKREQLMRFQQEMEQRLNEVKQTSENDCRVNAMKEHLRELHQAEKLERKERFERSLGGRIAMLWQRLDGR